MCYYTATGNRVALKALFLNLIQCVGNQKQTSLLFSSLKRLSLAKSPNLSTRSKFLPKSALLFVPLLLLLYMQEAMALSAKTSHTIKGSAPYLTFDSGQTKITDTNELLSITLPDGTKISPLTNTSAITPIWMPYAGNKLGDITMAVPSDTNLIDIKDLVDQGYWGDDDGDGQGTDGITATGSILVDFTDKNGNPVSRSDSLSICYAPYRIKLKAYGGYLKTNHGVPNKTYFNNDTVNYYINPYSMQPQVCSVMPNLHGGSLGPANIWDRDKGFLTEFPNPSFPSSYALNFPTTGADGLYFDLDIGGFDAGHLRWSVITSGSIRATVSRTRPHSGTFINPQGRTIEADEWILDKSKYVTRVTLNGPRATDSQINSSNPSPLNKPILPQTFELEGRDSNDNVIVRYGFVLKQWFVYRSKRERHNEQSAWCSSLGYRTPQVSDLTNATRTMNPPFSGAIPSSPYNNYQRRIGAGFFTEWGIMGEYLDANFTSDYVFTIDTSLGGHKFVVSAHNGAIADGGNLIFYAVCIP
ncbi:MULTISPECIES: hypothetical protein [unclassified Gilliamella]|uniref:hypothetical protein n=1 Tax=unclassified Gilliamella TaxID=2685620 RepID=UPI00132B8461|nr:MULTISPECIES: hypothetical protein [unclassified Gilliamella]MWN32520.1 hypothetical protein [Gilliamella sp. Pra-s60]MWP29918.1 hypothetical protein [Gilliamella sp. Pra-s54]